MRWLLECKPETASGPAAEEVQQWARGEAGGSVGQGWGCFTVSPYQFLRAEADEDPLGVFTVMSALHEGQEELGSIVLAKRSPC